MAENMENYEVNNEVAEEATENENYEATAPTKGSKIGAIAENATVITVVAGGAYGAYRLGKDVIFPAIGAGVKKVGRLFGFGKKKEVEVPVEEPENEAAEEKPKKAPAKKKSAKKEKVTEDVTE